MTHDEFLGHVQNRARLASTGEAETAVRATLETLAERLEAGLADNLAAQLPQELGRFLRGDVAENFRRTTVQEFFQRVCDREGAAVDPAAAAYHTRVVLEVLQEAVSPGIIQKVLATLPEEFRPIFEVGSQGNLDLNRPRRDTART
jgi:uncharacterized protein (DUF2267 family)